jgi:hypothetical protein
MKAGVATSATTGAGMRILESPLSARSELVISRDGRETYAFEPGETWGGRPGQLQFSGVSSTTGQLSSPVTVSLPARRVTATERDSIIDAEARRNSRVESEFRRLARLPEYYPSFTNVALMGDGLIWITEYARPQERVAIDSTGRVLARIQLPQSLVVFAATRTHVWGVLRDADDLPIVLRYRILM